MLKNPEIAFFPVIPAQAGIQEVIDNIECEFAGLPLSRELGVGDNHRVSRLGASA
jgi:hypothetical protein